MIVYHSEVEFQNKMKLVRETGICQCDTCIADRTPPSNISQGGGKPLPSLEQILELEEVEKCAQQNFKNIKIVNGQAQCQRCFMFVRLIPSGIEIETHKKRQLKLDDPKLTGKRKTLLKNQFDKYEEKLKRRNLNNIPLYRYRSGEIWICGRCLDGSQKRTI
jgi:hypothetical protein